MFLSLVKILIIGQFSEGLPFACSKVIIAQSGPGLGFSVKKKKKEDYGRMRCGIVFLVFKVRTDR